MSTVLTYTFRQTALSKQWRPKSDATKRGLESTLFATYAAVLEVFSSTKIDKFKAKYSYVSKYQNRVGPDQMPQNAAPGSEQMPQNAAFVPDKMPYNGAFVPDQMPQNVMLDQDQMSQNEAFVPDQMPQNVVSDQEQMSQNEAFVPDQMPQNVTFGQDRTSQNEAFAGLVAKPIKPAITYNFVSNL